MKAVWPAAMILLGLTGPLGAEDLAAPGHSDTRNRQGGEDPAGQDLVLLGPTRPLLVHLNITIDGKPFRPVWRQRLKQLFSEQDTANKGAITIEQATRIAKAFAPEDGLTAAEAKSGQTLEQIAAAAAGKITLGELQQFLLRAAPMSFAKRKSVCAAAISTTISSLPNRS